MKKVLLVLIVIASLVVVKAFFMPWAGVSTSVVRASRELTGSAEKKFGKFPELTKAFKELKKATDKIEFLGDVEIRSTISGYDVPRMVNQKSSKVALSLAQTIFKDAKDLDKKSYLVYALPWCHFVN